MNPAGGKGDEVMPKLDLERDRHKLRPTDLVYMRRVQEQNLERAYTVKRWRKRNNIFAVCLFGVACGIYAYTIRAVRQEKFLDDLTEPEKILEPAANK